MRKITIATLCVLLMWSVAIMAAQSPIATKPLSANDGSNGIMQPSWSSLSIQTHPDMPIPPAPLSDNPDQPHVLQGGDNIENAAVIPSLPYNDNGTTIDYVDDYSDPCGGTMGGPDVVYAYTPANDISVDIHLCGTSFYAILYVFENSSENVIGCNSFYLGCPGGPPSGGLDNLQFIGGNTYYIVVDGYYSSAGPYNFDIREHLAIPCPDGSVVEDEPACFDGYTDNYNGGCNSNPPVFQDIEDNSTICGTSGTYTTNDTSFRDTDWFRLTLTEQRIIHWSAVAEFPFQLFILYSPSGDCNDVSSLAWANDIGGDTATVSANALPGSYYLFISPYWGSPACGVTYSGWVSTEAPPQPPPNDNCVDVTPVPLVVGSPLVFEGDNTGATVDCNLLDNVPEAWIAFTTEATYDVNITYCGTTPAWGGGYVVLTTGCPCSDRIFSNTYDWYECGDGNLTMKWTALAPGTYYYPILTRTPDAQGLYHINVQAVGYASIDVTPTEISGEAQAGGSIDEPMTVSNIGTDNLTYQIITEQGQSLRQIDKASINSQLTGAALDLNSLKQSNLIDKQNANQFRIADVPHERRALQGGEDVSSAYPIDVLPFNDNGNTVGAIDDYSASCGGTGAPDLVYSIAPGRNMAISVSLCGSLFDTGLHIFENEAYNEIACNDDFCGSASQLTDIALTAGNTYYIVVDGYAEGREGDYVINVSEFIPCVVDCPPNAVAEIEPCGEDLNGGCNSTPQAFEEASLNSTICGTSWSNSGSLLRDTDWYTVTITEPTYLTFSAVGEFPIQTALIDAAPGCPPSADQILTYSLADPCSTASFSWTVYPGVYWLFVAPSNWYNQPCDGTGEYGNDYYVTINGSPAWLTMSELRGQIPANGEPANITATLNAAQLTPGQYAGTIRVFSNDLARPEIDIPVDFTVTAAPGCVYLPGDINGNHVANGIDIVYAVSYLKGSGNPPPVDCGGICPETSPFYAAGDVNGNCAFNGIDITYFVRFLKLQVPSLLFCSDCPPAGTAVQAKTPVISPTVIPSNTGKTRGLE